MLHDLRCPISGCGAPVDDRNDGTKLQLHIQRRGSHDEKLAAHAVRRSLLWHSLGLGIAQGHDRKYRPADHRRKTTSSSGRRSQLAAGQPWTSLRCSTI